MPTDQDNFVRSMLASMRVRDPTSAPPPQPEIHATDIAIIIAVGGGAFCAGLFGFYEGWPKLGTAFVIGGLAIMVPVSPFVRARVSWLSSRPALWAVALSTWIFLAISIGIAVFAPKEGSRPDQDHAAALAVGQPNSATRYYSAAEKDELENRISTISALLNGDMPQIASEWRRTSGAVLENFSSKQGFGEFLNFFDTLHDKTKALNQKLWVEAINGNADLAPDLRPLIGGDNQSLSQLETAAQNYRNIVVVASMMFGKVDSETMTTYSRAAQPVKLALQEAADNLLRWRDETNVRIAAKRKSL